ncbi:MAG: PepSY-like domain-containing protein [Sphingobacteriales bacterium]|nr:PepSY-like domain-containing protein [Sphingobacteriales bacterium]
MKAIFNVKPSLILIAFFAIGFTACKKNDGVSPFSSTNNTTGAVAIVSVNDLAGNHNTTSTDSVYAMDACDSNHRRNPILESALPTNITSYLKTNYVGYTFIKAFSNTLVSTNTLDGFVVAIMFNGKPVALKFDASGNFLKVLELRKGKDLDHKGDHQDGDEQHHKEDEHADSISLNSLPDNILQYFKVNYPQDTLKKAFTTEDSAIVVISKNLAFFSNTFKSDGTFIKRERLGDHSGGEDEDILQSNLPTSILNYLSVTYPNYIFEKAFIDKEDGKTKGYLVIIDANLTKYAVLFDGNGNFKEAKVIH